MQLITVTTRSAHFSLIWTSKQNFFRKFAEVNGQHPRQAVVIAQREIVQDTFEQNRLGII